MPAKDSRHRNFDAGVAIAAPTRLYKINSLTTKKVGILTFFLLLLKIHFIHSGDYMNSNAPVFYKLYFALHKIVQQIEP